MSDELARAYAGPLVRRGDVEPRYDLTPPPELAPQPFTARLYGMLAPLAQYDPQNAWSLLIYLNAAAWAYEQVEAWSRDTPTDPGWSLLLDVDRCPPEALGWLGQLVGVRLLPGASDDDNRQRIRSTDGFRRGTRAALIGAAQATLTGAATVVFRERDGADLGHPAAPDYAYYLGVRTYASQTPDPAATRAALLAQKPGGIVLDYQVATGQDYAQLHANHADYAAVKAAYRDYAAVVTDEPL